MNRLKALTLLFSLIISVGLSSCFDLGGPVPSPTATASEGQLVGHWVAVALTDMDEKYQKVSLRDKRQRELIVENLDTSTGKGNLTIVRRGIDYSGDWQFASQSNKGQIILHLDYMDENPDVYIPTLWSIMQIDENTLELATSNRKVMLRKVESVRGYGE